MNPTLKGAARSKTVWLNIALAMLGGLELAGSNLTTLFGPKPAAALVMVGALVNIGLRIYTTQALADKGSA
jgi:hypothetical protein